MRYVIINVARSLQLYLVKSPLCLCVSTGCVCLQVCMGVICHYVGRQSQLFVVKPPLFLCVCMSGCLFTFTFSHLMIRTPRGVYISLCW